MLQITHGPISAAFSGLASCKNSTQRSLVLSQASSLRAQAASTENDTTHNNGAANPLDFDELTEIIKMVHDTDIVEFELKSKKFSLAVRKKDAIERPEPVYQQAPQAALAPSPTPPPQPAAPSQPPTPTPAEKPAPGPSPSADNKAGTVEVGSPMSGTFYHSPAPGEPPFVKVGDKVTKGQTIGIIEAMKLMNEIEADSAGTIVEFTADNASSVTPGQGLVRIKP